MAIRSIGSAALLTATVLACGGGDRGAQAGGSDTAAAVGAKPSRSTGADLTGAGATFPNPIYTKWFDAYAKQTGVRINYQSIGSGGGIRQFTEGTVDFGATDGPMTRRADRCRQRERAARSDRTRRGGRHLQPAVPG